MPRLIVPSIGGGTKLMRTLRVADGTGIAGGVGDAVADGSSVGADDAVEEADGVGVGDSCASATVAAQIVKSDAIFFVMSSEVETSLTI